MVISWQQFYSLSHIESALSSLFMPIHLIYPSAAQCWILEIKGFRVASYMLEYQLMPQPTILECIFSLCMYFLVTSTSRPARRSIPCISNAEVYDLWDGSFLEKRRCCIKAWQWKKTCIMLKEDFLFVFAGWKVLWIFRISPGHAESLRFCGGCLSEDIWTMSGFLLSPECAKGLKKEKPLNSYYFKP